MTLEKEDALEAKILEDQLADLRTGLFFSMPISSALSGMILLVHLLSDSSFAALAWFIVVNAINSARIALAVFQPKTHGFTRDDTGAITRRLHQYTMLAFLSGIVWSLVAVLTGGFTSEQAALHMIILAGISAGAVIYSGSYAMTAIAFVTPPILVTAVCLWAQGEFNDYVLAFAVLLFLGGLVRSSLLGQSRFREASRHKHEANQIAADMERSSREDPLTGLLNRRGLEHAIDRLGNVAGPLVTMLIDLDGFKSVNDTYGHKIGDDLLARIARRIQEEAPEGATLARIGGDEFVLLYASAQAPAAPGDLASCIIAKIAKPYRGVASVKIGASVGVYVAEKPSLSEMLLRADIALYTAKGRGRNEFCLFDDDLHRELQRRQCIERDLRSAIETRSVDTWFQPIVELDSKAVVGFEALLRWTHPLHGPISPPEIVTAARETGMIQLLTETVFLGCCALIEQLAKADLRKKVRVAMNVSPRELEAGNIDEMILNGLEAKGLPPAMFEIEITEEAAVDPDRVDDKLARLSHAGISIALDDFGTGFSTLAALKDGRINKVKIDRGFIRGISRSPEDQLLVKGVIDIGTRLGIEVMAEGVETEADRHSLQGLGCRTAQGFLFSKAIPMEQALDMVAKKHAGQL